MKAAWWLVLLLAGGLGGCAAGGGASNPNLLAPKLVVQLREGNASLFVHSAFRELDYDWIRVDVDNQTVANRSRAFSFETSVPSSGFFVEVEAQAGALLYRTKARLDAAPEERVSVAFLDEEGWSEPRLFTLPYEKVLDRPKVDA